MWGSRSKKQNDQDHYGPPGHLGPSGYASPEDDLEAGIRAGSSTHDYSGQWPQSGHHKYQLPSGVGHPEPNFGPPRPGNHSPANYDQQGRQQQQSRYKPRIDSAKNHEPPVIPAQEYHPEVAWSAVSSFLDQHGYLTSEEERRQIRTSEYFPK